MHTCHARHEREDPLVDSFLIESTIIPSSSWLHFSPAFRHMVRSGAGVLIGLYALACFFQFLPPWIDIPAHILVQSAHITYTEQLQIIGRLHHPAGDEEQLRLFSQEYTFPVFSIHASGKDVIPASFAQGSIMVFNGTKAPFEITAGTIFSSSSGVSLRTTESMTIPASTFPRIASRTLPAQAVEAGTPGNIQAGTLALTCPCSPLLPQGVIIQNLQAFSGGQDAQILPVLTHQDIEQGQQTHLPSMLHQVQQAFGRAVSPPDHLAGEPGCGPDNSKVNPPENSHASSAWMQITMHCQGVLYNVQDLFQKAGHLFLTRIHAPQGASGQGISSLSGTSLDITASRPPQATGTEGMIFPLTVRVHQVLRLSRFQQEQIKKELAGKAHQDALSVLHQYREISSASIKQGGWPWMHLPEDPQAITLSISSGPGVSSP